MRYTSGWQQNQVEFLLIKLSKSPTPQQRKTTCPQAPKVLLNSGFQYYSFSVSLYLIESLKLSGEKEY